MPEHPEHAHHQVEPREPREPVWPLVYPGYLLILYKPYYYRKDIYDWKNTVLKIY
jgi:hypothetical protein